MAGDYPIEIGSITFPEKGLIEIRDVTIDLPEEGGRAGKIDRILLRYDPAKPLDAHARSLVIENPDFTLDDRLLGMCAPKNEDKDSAPMDLSWAQLDQLKIINGTINLNLQGIPTPFLPSPIPSTAPSSAPTQKQIPSSESHLYQAPSLISSPILT